MGPDPEFTKFTSQFYDRPAKTVHLPPFQSFSTLGHRFSDSLLAVNLVGPLAVRPLVLAFGRSKKRSGYTEPVILFSSGRVPDLSKRGHVWVRGLWGQRFGQASIRVFGNPNSPGTCLCAHVSSGGEFWTAFLVSKVPPIDAVWCSGDEAPRQAAVRQCNKAAARLPRRGEGEGDWLNEGARLPYFLRLPSARRPHPPLPYPPPPAPNCSQPAEISA